MSIRQTVATWSLSVVGGAAGTIAAALFLHQFPIPESRPSGTLVAVEGQNNVLVIVDAAGKHSPVIEELQARLLTRAAELGTGYKAISQGPAYWDQNRHEFWAASTLASPAGAVVNSVISTFDGRGGVLRQAFLNEGGETLGFPTPSPAGDVVAYEASTPAKGSHLSLVRATGAPEAKRLTVGGGPPRWSKDGNELIYACAPEHGSRGVCIYDTRKERERTVTVPGFDGLLGPALSPDGKEGVVAGSSGPGITEAVLVFDTITGKLLAVHRSAAGVSAPVWSPDGAWIAYVDHRGVEVCDKQLKSCRLAVAGDFTTLQWTRSDIPAFGIP